MSADDASWHSSLRQLCPPTVRCLAIDEQAPPPAVILDFDSTLFPLLEAIARLPGLAHVSYARTPDWGHLVDACGGMAAMEAAFARVMQLEAMAQTGLFPGAAAGVRHLAAEGWHCLVVTDRDPGFAAATLALLAAHEVPHVGLVCGSVCKVSVARAVGARLLIDDKPDTLAAAAVDGLAATALAWPYNAAVAAAHGLERGDDWLQLTRISARLLRESPPPVPRPR